MVQLKNTDKCHGVSSVGTVARAELSVVGARQRTPGAVTLVEGVRKRNHGHLAFGDSYRVDRCGAQNPLHRSRSNAVSAMSRKLGPCVHFLPSSELQGLD